ncbi:MAG: tetratricopeptide repeat protein [Opitutaceae bacterium]|nr:tetratricopeptide repeat protein [Opitutaceae bacterium]
MKTLTPRLAAALVVAAIFALAASAAESLSVLLQKGIYAEETEGNLDSAIKIYEQIAAESAANRPLAAQAQYRLAVCYQKKGNKEQAISTFNDVLKQFPTDVALGQKAREALAQLGQTPSDDLKIRRVATLDGTPLGVTPDGRFAIYQPLARPMDRSIYEIETGKIWATLKGDPENTVRGVFFSPDGRRTSYRYAGVIYVVGIDGADPKPVYRMDKDTRAMPMGWADDRTMWVNWWSGEKWTYGTVKFVGKLDIETGMLKEIARLRAHENEGRGLGLSPDGRYATLFARPNLTGPAQLWSLALDSGHVHTLVEKEVSEPLGWFGTSLIFTRESDHVQEMWKIAVKDGKPADEPKLVRSDLRTANLCGVTQDGSVYYSERTPNWPKTELWVIEGFLAQRNQPMWVQIPVESVRASDSAIFDPKFGVEATIPSGGAIKSAHQLISSYYGRRRIWLSIPGVATNQIIMSYGPRVADGFPAIARPTSLSTDEIAAQLGENTRRRMAAGQGNSGPDLKFRKDTLVARSIGNNSVFSGVADFTDKGQPWVAFFSEHYSATTWASAVLQVKPTDFDKALPEFRRLSDTIQLR